MKINPNNALAGLADTDLLRLLERLAGLLGASGTSAYIVGGWVRDMLLGRQSADIDIAVSADPHETARMVAAALDGKYVRLDNKNGVGRVVLPGSSPELDFAGLRGGLEADLALRDFSINAMAVDLVRLPSAFPVMKLLDPCRGLADLESGTVRAVSDSVFTDDAARMLRAVRLAAELGFNIEERTGQLIIKNASYIAGVAGERVREELLRLLNLPRSGRTLARLDRLSLLTALFPELEQARGVAQPPEHQWDVFQHSLRTVDAVDFLLGEGEWPYIDSEALSAVKFREMPVGYFEQEVGYGSRRKSLLRLAALLHDVSKPASKTTETGGRIRFLGHDRTGAEVVAERLERLRFSAREIKMVAATVRYHMRPTQMSNGGLPSDRAIYRFFRDAGESALDILFLNLADHLAARGGGLDTAGWREHADMVGYVIRQRFEKEKIVIPPKLVNGYDIIGFLGGRAGPEVGRALEAVREAQASGEVANREEALAYVEKWLAAAGNR